MATQGATAGAKRKQPDTAAPAAAEAEEAVLTPLEREILHMEQEKAGDLTFPVHTNDSKDASVVALVKLKAIFCEQLPKMPKEYISRLVLDRQHVSLACVFQGEVVGGITYRPVASQRLAEIVFCAVSARHQVQGYGTRIMNQIKEECKRTGIQGMLTYADNHAVGYFRKQGFKKQVTMKRERWQGYLKDYEGATLMECLVDPTIDYLTTRQVAEQQRKALVARVAELGAQQGKSNAAVDAAAQGERHKELLRTGWKTPALEIHYRGQVQALEAHLHEFLEEVAKHEDAWCFLNPVSVEEAPDYYTVIKNPVDISLLRKRLEQASQGKPYYRTPEQMRAELCIMCENCRQYNGEPSTYSDSATRLQEYIKTRAAETTVVRRRTEDEQQEA